MSNFAVILPAAGKSSRFKDKNYKKPFAPLAGKAVWLYSAERFLNRDDVKQVIVVISPEDKELFHMKFGANIAILGIDVVEGGKDRTESVSKGLAEVRGGIDFVAIHDAARPCIADEWIDKVFAAAQKSGAAILANPVASTLKKVQNGVIVDTVPRENVWEAQTPQVFRRELLEKAYAQSNAATDDAGLIERLGTKVSIVEGSPMNLKITTRADLRMAEKVLAALPKPKIQGPGNPFADGDMWR